MIAERVIGAGCCGLVVFLVGYEAHELLIMIIGVVCRGEDASHLAESPLLAIRGEEAEPLQLAREPIEGDLHLDDPIIGGQVPPMALAARSAVLL